MKTVFGLFDQKEKAEAVAAAARKAGIADERIRLLDGSSPAQSLVEPAPRSRVIKGVRGFTLLGLLIFAVFGAFAAVGSVTSTGAPVSFAVQIFVLFLLIGLFSGLGMGFVKGRSDAEQETQAFREAFERGATLAVIEADKQANDIAKEMQRAGGQMVQISSASRAMSGVAGQVAVAAH